MIDFDYFKRVNDIYGYQSGDTILMYISYIIKETLSGNDVIAQCRGEEIIVIIPETGDDKSNPDESML